jgi:hypothetical protein
MMVDDHDHSRDLGCLGEYPMGVSFFQKPAQSGCLLNREIMSAGPLEKTFLRAHREDKLVVSVWLYLADLPNQINH